MGAGLSGRLAWGSGSDMTAALDKADPGDIAALYAALDLSLVYEEAPRRVDVTINLSRGAKFRVRGGT